MKIDPDFISLDDRLDGKYCLWCEDTNVELVEDFYLCKRHKLEREIMIKEMQIRGRRTSKAMKKYHANK